MTERQILQALKNNEPFQGLPNVRATNLIEQPQTTLGSFDAKFDLQYGDAKVEVYVEAKTNCTPKQTEEIGTVLAQAKAMQKGVAFALVCPGLSPQSQKLCLEKNVDFIDLAGNVFINVPGKVLLQRVGMEVRQEAGLSFYRNPFSGRSSRILRVLLQKPKTWTLTEIAEELAAEGRRLQCPGVSFKVSSSLVSRVLRSLEEELLIIRTPTPCEPDQVVSQRNGDQDRLAVRRNPILVPEPGRLLAAWAQKYKDRCRAYLRRSFKIPNPFGADLRKVNQALDGLLKPQCYAFTSAAAASLTAPFVDVDPIDIYVSDQDAAETLRAWIPRTGLSSDWSGSVPVERFGSRWGTTQDASVGPDLRLNYAFDAGVFLYSTRKDRIPVVSDIQAYLDLFARGGRDLKQADYLLEQQIDPLWRNGRSQDRSDPS